MNFREKLTVCMVAVIVVSFFMPWITVESKAIGDITSLLTGKKQSVLDSISGFRVPLLANSKESRFMISVIKIFNPQIREADRKSYLLWVVPLIAVLIVLAERVFKRIRVVRFFLGIIALSIVGATIYKLLITDLDKLVLKVNIAFGLWLTLFGFFTIGIVELASVLSNEELSSPNKEALKDRPPKAADALKKEKALFKKKSGKDLLFKILGLGLIIFTIAADWIKWGVLTGFSNKQIIVLAVGLILFIYGLASSGKKGDSHRKEKGDSHRKGDTQ